MNGLNVEAILDKILGAMSTRTVVGEPMEVQGLTLVPVLTIAFGFGAGGGEAPNAQQGGSGGGGGGGARVKVEGVLVIKDGDARFLPTTSGGTLDRLLDMVPDLLQKAKIKVEKARQDESNGD
ncbi:MAG: spore germination protein GerW family protein [Bacillota bacterium]